MVTRAEVVAEARTCIDTPWVHQQHTKGLACDCGGLARIVMVNLGLMGPDPERWPGAAPFIGYARHATPTSLLEACDAFMTRIGFQDMQPGDLVVASIDKNPQHVGILGDYRHGGLSIIHAANAARPPRVIETRLMWSRSMRFVAAYSFPGVA